MSFMDKVRQLQSEGRHVSLGMDTVFGPPREEHIEQNEALGLAGKKKLLCIPAHLKVPGQSRAEIFFKFNKAIIDACIMNACVVKINAAHYSTVYGDDIALIDTVKYSHSQYPNVPVIVDAKRTDIGNTNKEYVAEVFEKFGADGTTVNAYFGQEGVQPFLDQEDKGIFVLARTSNPGAEEFQVDPSLMSVDAIKSLMGENFVPPWPEFKQLSDESARWFGVPFYLKVAMRVAKVWNKKGNCGLVVGATAASQQFLNVRELVGPMEILLPGYGAQKGSLDMVDINTIVNSSRGIIFASADELYVEAAAVEARKVNEASHAVIASRKN